MHVTFEQIFLSLVSIFLRRTKKVVKIIGTPKPHKKEALTRTEEEEEEEEER